MLSSRDVRQCSTIIPRNTEAVNIRFVAANRSALCHSVGEDHACPVPNWLATSQERNRFTGIRSFRGYSFDWTWESTDAPSWWVLLDRRTWVHVGTDRVKEYVVDRVPVSRWLKRYKDGCELYLLLGLRGLWIHWRSSRSGSWKSLRKRDMGSDWKFLFFCWSISILEILHFNYFFVNMY